MAIEGPLRELGIHDVFQLLDLSRKTGLLQVRSDLRADEGTVAFDNGRVVAAGIRSRGIPLEMVLLQLGRVSETELARARERMASRPGVVLAQLLVEIGAISQRELERQARQQIETVVFELMSWSEGFFSFEERPRAELPEGLHVAVSTESLLMEGARRIDEWSRIADTVPNAEVVPELAPVSEDHEASALDLLPHEWQVLTMIDGERDLRSIAGALGRDDFDIAKIAYGLVRTGVLELRGPRARPAPAPEPVESDTVRRRLAARTHSLAGRHPEAVDELRRAVRLDPIDPELHRALGCAAARAGDFALARTSWEHALRLSVEPSDIAELRVAVDAMTALIRMLESDVAG